MKIVVDGFGGDHAPLAVLQGCALAVEEYGVDILVTGDETVPRKTAEENGVSLNGIEIVHAPGVITMENDPTSTLILAAWHTFTIIICRVTSLYYRSPSLLSI